MKTNIQDGRILRAQMTAAAQRLHPPWVGKAVVMGPAMSQGSKRIGRSKTGLPIVLDDDRKLAPWRKSMSEAMRQDAPVVPLNCAVAVRLTIYVARPQSHYGTGGRAGFLKEDAPRVPPTGRDCDKVARAVGDAGTGIWWRDDARIARWQIERRYDEDGRERTEVEAEIIGDTEA